VEVGQALLEIRDSRLYLETHDTFEFYCRERWGMDRVHAHRHIQAAEVATVLSIDNTGSPAPANVAVARELAPLRDEPAVLREAWSEAVDLHGPQPTAAEVREVVEEKRGTAQLLVASTENEWYTPARYLDAARRVLGVIDLDPASSERANETVGAAAFYTQADDGLNREWHGRVWLNPPYGRLAGEFIERLVDEYRASNIASAVALVNAHCTDTAWFQKLWDFAVCFTDHRIDFDSAGREKHNSSTHGSVFAYLGPDPQTFTREFSAFGAVVRRA
jgi:phage N-6-adenine-methyltransferase